MKIEMRELEIELIPETEHERDAVVRLLSHHAVTVKDGHTTDSGWPPSPRKTNAVLVMPDPNKW